MKKYWLIIEQGAKNKFEKILFCKHEDLPNYHLLSGPYNTERELKDVCKIANFTCSKCGGLVGLSYYPEVVKELTKYQLCFRCNHFRGVMNAAKNNKNRVIIDGNSFHIANEYSNSFIKGFGGREFKIIRNDNPGCVITTTNLWHQGEIPKIWRKDIPDNAKFLKIKN